MEFSLLMLSLLRKLVRLGLGIAVGKYLVFVVLLVFMPILFFSILFRIMLLSQRGSMYT